jgi:hypothetical protein
MLPVGPDAGRWLSFATILSRWLIVIVILQIFRLGDSAAVGDHGFIDIVCGYLGDKLFIDSEQR